MGAYWKILIAVGVVGYFLACSPVKFSKQPAPACNGTGIACATKCSGSDCFDIFETEKMVGEGLADILIVNDNSGSMSTEQAHMGEKFPTFLQGLGDLDYRIGMITTDVSSNVSDTKSNYPRAINQNGKLQDGALVEFASGVPYLTPSTPNAASVFNTAIRRQETISCEQNNYNRDLCPSGDERGVFAASLALERNDQGFFRPTAPLAIIVLADEDERSGLYPGGSQNTNSQDYGFSLQDSDRPETLVSRFRAQYPNKTLSVHSIIVKNGDQSCLNTQSAQGGSNPYVRGSYGLLYAQLSQLTGGVIGSVCEADYGKQLGEIAYAIQDQIPSVSFPCPVIEYDLDDDGTLEYYKLSFEPQPPFPVAESFDRDRLLVEFDKELPPRTKIHLKYACEKTKN